MVLEKLMQKVSNLHKFLFGPEASEDNFAYEKQSRANHHSITPSPSAKPQKLNKNPKTPNIITNKIPRGKKQNQQTDPNKNDHCWHCMKDVATFTLSEGCWKLIKNPKKKSKRKLKIQRYKKLLTKIHCDKVKLLSWLSVFFEKSLPDPVYLL